MSNIGKILSDRRKELHLTLEEVGNAVGVSKSTVKKWETGYISNMRRDKISALSKILDLNVNIIIDEDENAPIIDSDDLLAGVELVERDNKKILDDCYDKADSDGKRAIVAYAQQIISDGEIPTIPDVFIDYYNRVNEEGKVAILKYVKYIASDDEYKKCDTDDADLKEA